MIRCFFHREYHVQDFVRTDTVHWNQLAWSKYWFEVNISSYHWYAGLSALQHINSKDNLFPNDTKKWNFRAWTRHRQHQNYDPQGPLPHGMHAVFIIFDLFCCLFFRDSFPYDLQFSILTRFITDQTQTPNLKVCRWTVSILLFFLAHLVSWYKRAKTPNTFVPFLWLCFDSVIAFVRN